MPTTDVEITKSIVRAVITIELKGKEEIERFGADFNNIYHHVEQGNKEGLYDNNTLNSFKIVNRELNFQ